MLLDVVDVDDKAVVEALPLAELVVDIDAELVALLVDVPLCDDDAVPVSLLLLGVAVCVDVRVCVASLEYDAEPLVVALASH